jgi:hypothetical protein
VPEILQTDDLVALVPSRLLRKNDKRLIAQASYRGSGFRRIAVWHPRIDKMSLIVGCAPLGETAKIL